MESDMTGRKQIYRVLLRLIALLALTSLILPFSLQAQEPGAGPGGPRPEGQDRQDEEYTPLIHDALIRPPLPGEVSLRAPEGLTAQQEGGPPDYYQTSEYMAGRVAVGIILPHSH